jgi:hypothetical protein
MSTIIHNVAVDPASARPWKWRGRLGRCARAPLPHTEMPAGCSEFTAEPQDLDFPLAPISAMASIRVVKVALRNTAGRMLLMPWTMMTMMVIA